MKKSLLYKYDDVELSVPSTLAAVDWDAECPVKVGYGMQFVGRCHSFRFALGKLLCSVESATDLKGLYPVLIATIDGGKGNPISLNVSRELLNVDETLEPFI